MDLNESLRELGLSKHECKVYLGLLALGRTNAGPLISHTRLHRQLVYIALERLQELGLASSYSERRRKVFQASEPSALVKMQERKLDAARAALPNLQRLLAQDKERLEVKVLHGAEDFWRNLEEVVLAAARDDHIMRIIGGAPASDVYRVIGRHYADYVALLEVQQVQKQLIAPSGTSDEFRERFAKEKANELRLMPQGLSSPTYTRITASLVSIEIYTQEIMVIQIFNRAVARGYREHFDFLWRQAASA